MIRKRHLVFVAVLFFLLFIITSVYLLVILSSYEKQSTIEDKIYQELNKLPVNYKSASTIEDKSTDLFLTEIKATQNRGIKFNTIVEGS
ncbi:hypothetical protein NQ317_008448 [Molorchus minor]|uniref:Sensor histidine kinase n=1 Tax=Molorchus minor TaxID=1323400 RepID=A0ABQ9JDR4_9CUCU|nr:hypothetical protein NQ317_008448 [Molorchus minor]